MKLSHIRDLGRYVNPNTGRPVNVKTGQRVGRGVTVLFYVYRGKRIWISDKEFYSDQTWKSVPW